MRRIIIAAILLMAGFSSAHSRDSSTIDLGNVREGRVIRGTFTVSNTTGETREYLLTVSCSCVRLETGGLVLHSGEERSVMFSFDSSGYDGKVERTIIISSTPDSGNRVITVTADVHSGSAETDPCPTCERSRDPAAAEKYLQERSESTVYIDFYADRGCRSCITFSGETVPRLRTEYERPFVFSQHDIMDPAVMDELLARMNSLDVPVHEFPIAIIGNTVFQGTESIEAGMESVLTESSGDTVSPVPGQSEPDFSLPRNTGSAGISFSAMSVVLAGLADGINPCAFSTILFLISMLAVAGRNRKQILSVGIVFTLVVFIGYYAAGLGLFSSVRALLFFPAAVSVVRWVLIAFLTVLAALSVRDAVLARKGRTREMVLQLSDGMKKRIHRVVRDRVRMASIVAGTVVMALLVTVFEFSCTGQVYIPVIMHLARTQGKASAYWLLAAYNVAFIIPLILVFAVSYSGVALKSVSDFFSRRVAGVKIVLACVFAGLAVLTLFT